MTELDKLCREQWRSYCGMVFAVSFILCCFLGPVRFFKLWRATLLMLLEAAGLI